MFKKQVKPPEVITYSKEWTTHDFYGKYHLSHIKNPRPVPGTQVVLETEHLQKKKEDTERYEAEAKARDEFNDKRRVLKNESTEFTMRVNFNTRIGKLESAAEETIQENVELFNKEVIYPNTKKEIQRFMKNISLGRYHYISFAVTTGYKSLDYRDATDNLGYTALHIASAKGHHETVNELLKYKADSNVRNSLGDLPIHLAWSCWRQPCEKKEERLDQEGKTIEVIRSLLKWGAFVNCTATDTGDTPLHIACRLGPVEVVKMLLGFKADHLLPNKGGTTPVDVAAENGNEDILNVLNCWNGVRSQLINADFIIQWKAFLADYEAVISNGKDVETLIFEMNMRENLRKQELLMGGKFLVDDPVLIRSKNEAVMHQKVTARAAALKASAEEEEGEFHSEDCGKTVTSEGAALGPKGTSMCSAEVPDWMQLMNIPVRKKKKKKVEANPVEMYYKSLVEKNRPKDSEVLNKRYLEQHKKRTEREGAAPDEEDPFGNFVQMQYKGEGTHTHEEQSRPNTKLRDRRHARARLVGLDAKFELFTKRPSTSSPLFIARRTDNAPLKGTEEEISMNRYFSTTTRSRNLVVQALGERKKMGVRAYAISDNQLLTPLGAYAKESNCIADPSVRQQLYDRVLDTNGEQAKLAKQNRMELNKMLESNGKDAWRGQKVDMVPSEKRLRFVPKELVPPSKELSALDELKGKILKDQQKLGLSNQNDKEEQEEGKVDEETPLGENDAGEQEERLDGNADDKLDKTKCSELDAKLLALEEKNSKKSSKVLYGKGRLISSHQMKKPLAKPWGNVRSDFKLAAIV